VTIYKVSGSQSIRIESIQAIEISLDGSDIYITLSSQVMRLDHGYEVDRIYDEVVKLMEQCND
jgi:hypothetical protein